METYPYDFPCRTQADAMVKSVNMLFHYDNDATKYNKTVVNILKSLTSDRDN